MADNLSVISEKDNPKKRALQQPQSQTKTKTTHQSKAQNQPKTTQNQLGLT
jgi:hypothetical protein